MWELRPEVSFMVLQFSPWSQSTKLEHPIYINQHFCAITEVCTCMHSCWCEVGISLHVLWPAKMTTIRMVAWRMVKDARQKSSMINIQTSVFVTLLSRGKLKQAFLVVVIHRWDNRPSKLHKWEQNGTGKNTQTDEAVIQGLIPGLRKVDKQVFDFLSSLIAKARFSEEANCQNDIHKLFVHDKQNLWVWVQSCSANLFPMFVAESVAVLKTGPICVGGTVQKAGPEYFQ